MNRSLVLCGALLVLFVSVAACQAPTAPATPTPVPTPVIAAESPQATILATWQKSKHATTFVQDQEGANNACARCHAPHNWLPTDPADMPETCANCKFTIKTPKPVAKAEWRSIPCETCHRVDKDTITPKVAFLNTAISQFESGTDPYQDVTANKDLCQKCHTDYNEFAYSVNMGSGAHAKLDCTTCHNAHSGTASCMAAGCHVDILKTVKPGHDAAHAAVACSACHDASGLKVGPAEDKKWTTWRAAAPGGQPGQSPYVSHAVQRAVDCARCHFPKNPWGLRDSVK